MLKLIDDYSNLAHNNPFQLQECCMSNTIFCTKLKQELPALESPPFSNELGIKIADSISKKAWNMWLSQQTMLINEYRLNLIDAKAREFLFEEMNKFLFNE